MMTIPPRLRPLPFPLLLSGALLFLFALQVAPLRAQDERVVAGLSQNRITISTGFDGSEILVFGAVRRESPPPADSPLQVIISVSGPAQPVTVRRKEKRLGIWVNTDAVEIGSAPSFYAVASSAPFGEALSEAEDLRYRVSIPRAIGSIEVPDEVSDPASFTEALIRIRSRSGLYQTNPGTVHLSEETLFETSVELPSNLTEGDYRIRIFLTRNGRVIDAYETSIAVRKVGLERFLYSLAHERPLLYGLMSLAIAIIAGWGASAAFRLIKS